MRGGEASHHRKQTLFLWSDPVLLHATPYFIGDRANCPEGGSTSGMHGCKHRQKCRAAAEYEQIHHFPVGIDEVQMGNVQILRVRRTFFGAQKHRIPFKRLMNLRRSLKAADFPFKRERRDRVKMQNPFPACRYLTTTRGHGQRNRVGRKRDRK